MLGEVEGASSALYLTGNFERNLSYFYVDKTTISKTDGKALTFIKSIHLMKSFATYIHGSYGKNVTY